MVVSTVTLPCLGQAPQTVWEDPAVSPDILLVQLPSAETAASDMAPVSCRLEADDLLEYKVLQESPLWCGCRGPTASTVSAHEGGGGGWVDGGGWQDLPFTVPQH